MATSIPRRPSQEDVFQPVVGGGAPPEIGDRGTETHGEQGGNTQERKASSVTYSSGGTVLDMAWNAGVRLWHIAFDREAGLREQVRGRMDTTKFSIAQVLAICIEASRCRVRWRRNS